MSGARPGERVLMKGNEAIAEAAIRAGCRAYFGYPITPQNELIAWMARHLEDRGGVFVQAESEIAAVNMTYGASAAGARAMTSSSSPGISLKQEGISYAAGSDIPMVVVNVARGGPGLGSISPAQSDYFQSTRGGGHGDYRCIVLAPKSVQECADLTALAFELSDRYRMPAILLADGIIGQMMEAVVLPDPLDPALLPRRDWTLGRAEGRPSRHINSMILDPDALEAKTRARFARYGALAEAETRFEAALCDDADIILVAYGTAARVALGAQQLAAEAGIKAGLFRPITLFPFPGKALARVARGGKPVLTVEMSLGQLVEDVKLSLFDASSSADEDAGFAGGPVHLLGHSGGVVPSEEEIFAEIRRILGDAGKMTGGVR